MILTDLDWFDVVRLLDPDMCDEDVEDTVRDMREYAARMEYLEKLN